MTHENPQNLEEQIFDQARKKSTPAARAAFLDVRCRGNPELRAAVEELLTLHFAELGFLPAVTVTPVNARSPGEPAPVDDLPDVHDDIQGRYAILEKLGEGGFGEVWLAEQRQPVKRQVALKIIKPGMDSRQIVARFEAERQALAMMDHPNIARILDAGTTDAVAARRLPGLSPPASGRPFFVMELVRGVRITDYCDRHQISIADRIRLFIPVCNAVQHAHQKGIVHRDLKPSNILVCSTDGVPVPKVIDFGIAKALQQDLDDGTVLTHFSQFVGTPSYASPEQAAANLKDIDTRSDVYSLGVLLYELLVGKTPFDANEMMQGGLDNLRRVVLEKEPLQPSTRLMALSADDQTSAAQSRKTDTQRLRQQLRGDLDWIVLKCLEKDRNRRYETASELASELRRYLSNEPVTARPPSTAYKVHKAWLRNRATWTAAMIVLLALAAATIVSWKQAFQARQSQQIAEVALQQEALERQRATASERNMQELLYGANMNLIGQAWDADDFGRIRDLLDQTSEFPRPGFEWYYWQKQLHQELRTFRGHTARVWSAGFSPDGTRVVTASDDGTARVWDVATGESKLALSGHLDWVRSAVFSPDGTLIATGSKDYIVRVLDAKIGTEIRQLTGHRGAIRSVAFSPDGGRIVSACQDGTARTWDIHTGRSLVILRGHSNWLFSALFSPDGSRIVTSGDDETARIWDAADGRELRRLKGHQGNVRMAAFSPDGRKVVTAGRDQTMRIWDSESGMMTRTITGHSRNIFCAAFSPDGTQIVSSSGDRTVRIWDAATGKELNQLRGHGSEIYTAAFSPDGRRVLTASEDGTARIWDVSARYSEQSLHYGSAVYAVAIAPDGNYFAAAGQEGHIMIWSASSRDLMHSISNSPSPVRSLAYSPDGQRIVAGQMDGTLRAWSCTDGSLSLTFAGHMGAVNSVAFSSDGRRMVTAGGEGRIKVWDFNTGKEISSIPPRYRESYSARFSPDGSRILVASERTVALLHAETGQELLNLPTPTRVFSACFSQDGQRILGSANDKVTRIWDAATGDAKLTLSGHTRAIYSVSLDPDGSRIVTASLDGSVRVWNAISGKELLRLQGPEVGLSTATFSRDGRSIVAGGLEGSVRIWQAASNAEVESWEREEKTTGPIAQHSVDAPSATSPSLGLQPNIVSRWLLLAPIDIPDGDILRALDADQVGGEALLRPHPGQHVLVGKKDLTWEPVEQWASLLDFNLLVGKVSSPNSLAYAVCHIISESPRKGLVFKLISDDECKVYLNGQLIHRSLPERNYVLDEETVEGMELKEGLNTVVFKIVNGIEYWRGSVRIMDPKGKPIPGLHYTLSPSR